MWIIFFDNFICEVCNPKKLTNNIGFCNKVDDVDEPAVIDVIYGFELDHNLFKEVSILHVIDMVLIPKNPCLLNCESI